MNIDEAKVEVKNAVRAYLEKDEWDSMRFLWRGKGQSFSWVLPE